MKIVMVGGGTGGHFYPHIAVAQQIYNIAEERRILTPTLIYIGPAPFDGTALAEQNIEFVKSPAGRIRRYASARNIFDSIKTAWGAVRATFQLFGIFPDVIFSTGGYAAFPSLFAARLLGIPVIIYDADATPGRVSLWSSKFARWIGVAHPDAADGFPKAVRDRIARVGHPIRVEIEHITPEGGREFLKIEEGRPTLLVLGGSQGAQTINNVIIDALPQLLPKYNIIHQTGKDHLDEVAGMARISVATANAENRYRTFGLLNALALRMAAGISDLVISRAGSGTIFEIASWGLPAIIIPIPESVSHDQTRNAFSYARSGAAVVMEQENLRTSILISEIERILGNPEEITRMKEAAKAFAKPDAAHKIAKILIDTALEHTK